MSRAMLLVAASGLVLAGYAAAASSGALPDEVDMGLGANAKCQRLAAGAGAPGTAAEVEQRVEQRVQRCEGSHHKMGLPPFQVEEGSVEGRWVAFDVDAGANALRGYTSKGPMADAVIFDSVTVSPGGEQASLARRGLWLGKTGDVAVASFNAPNAFLGVFNRGEAEATVTYDLAEGMQAEPLPDGAKGLRLTLDGHGAWLRLRGNGTVSVDGDLVTVTLGKGEGAVFAVEGYPHLLRHEIKALQHLAEKARERGEGQRPLPPQAQDPAQDPAGGDAGLLEG